MTQTLTAKEQSLDKIFGNDYIFHIPGYQRPYAWGPEQATELVDDVLQALQDAADVADIQDASPYFLGSIVLIKRESSPECEVVDGQQRLTTLTLLLAAIRMVVNRADVQTGITQLLFEPGNVVAARAPRYRLSLRERDRDFFRQYVQHEAGLPHLLALTERLPDARARLQANAKVFVEKLHALPEQDLIRLVQFILLRCYLVVVATPDLDSAYRIFGVLNSRGLDLNATDILKADILGRIPAEHRDRYTQQWEDHEDALGREAFAELFGHIRMIYRKSKPKGTLLKEFKQHVTAVAQSQSFMDLLLTPMAEAYAVLSGASYASIRLAEAVNASLTWLNRIEFKDWVPPALAFYVRHSNDPEGMLAFFVALERLAFSMLVRKVGVNDRIERFSKITYHIESGLPWQDAASPLQLSALEQFETYAALDGPLYDNLSPRNLAVLLLRLDSLLCDASASYQHDVVSVEHVMPKSPEPNSQWLAWVPDPAEHQRWLHRLGNLTLLSRNKNSAASNYSFEKKKAAYFTKGGVCAFALTTLVLQHDTWTTEVMQARQKTLLNALEQHWQLHGRMGKDELARQAFLAKQLPEGLATFELESKKHGLSARAVELGDAFKVLKGSQARLEWSSTETGYTALRQRLIDEGALVRGADAVPTLVFVRDVAFSSPSAASATVLGRTDNGRTTWRLAGTSQTYADWAQTLPADRIITGQRETG
ncbi:MAG: DUF262 domain-containing protein [Rhodoferax sp.]